MAREIVQEYLTCEIDSANSFTATSAGKDLAVEVSGNATSMHPQVKLVTDNGVVFGKLISFTPNGKQCRVATRGSNMQYATAEATDPNGATADVGKGILGAGSGQVKAGAAVGSRGVTERGVIVGGTKKNIRVDYDN